MKAIKIVSDSACDLTDEMIADFGITVVPFYVTLDGENYLKEAQELTRADFYKALRNKSVFPKTSLPSVSDYLDKFRVIAEQGNDILCFCIHHVFSGSLQSAITAAGILRDEYPNTAIKVMDSKSVSFGQGDIVIEAARLVSEGYTMDDVEKAVSHYWNKVFFYFTVDSLDYLQKGGRIGKAAALAGGLLNLKPIIALRDGELHSHSRVRGRKKALDSILDIVEKEYKNIDCPGEYVALHTDAYDEALALQQEAAKRFGVTFNYKPITVGVTVGAHVGETLAGLGFVPKLSVSLE